MHSIKLLGLVLAVFVVALVTEGDAINKDQKDMFMMMTEDCRKKNGATEDDVKSMLEGDVPKSKTGQCTNTCLMKQFKIVKKNGDKLEIDCDTILKFAEAKLNKEMLAKATEICAACKAPGTTDECEFSAKVGACLVKEGEARGITKDMLQSM